MSRQWIPDDEVVFRRIPSSAPWFEPPDSISSANFKLARNELGKSVYRAKIVTGAEVLAQPDAKPDSFLVQATVGDIRRLTNARGQSLDLDVIAVNDESDPGHAEIRGPTPGRLAPAASKALQRVFTKVPLDAADQSGSPHRSRSTIDAVPGLRVIAGWLRTVFQRSE